MATYVTFYPKNKDSYKIAEETTSSTRCIYLLTQQKKNVFGNQ